VVWIGDDPADRDNLPLVDGQMNADGTPNLGANVVVLVVQAYGAAGARRAVELTVARQPSGEIRLQAWRELRQ
jgi:hypothetical protein